METGEIPPDQVHVPGIYVDRLIKGEQYEKRIEVFYIRIEISFYALFSYNCYQYYSVYDCSKKVIVKNTTRRLIG